MICREPSIPDDSPAVVMILPLSTKRRSETTLVLGAAALRRSIRLAVVVASRPSSSPALLRINAPLHTDMTMVAPWALSWIHCITAGLFIAERTLPPGTTRMSGWGELATVYFGLTLIPIAVVMELGFSATV